MFKSRETHFLGPNNVLKTGQKFENQKNLDTRPLSAFRPFPQIGLRPVAIFEGPVSTNFLNQPSKTAAAIYHRPIDAKDWVVGGGNGERRKLKTDVEVLVKTMKQNPPPGSGNHYECNSNPGLNKLPSYEIGR